MRIDRMILTGIMAGIISGILDGYEQDHGLNHITSVIILTILTITLGYLIHKFESNETSA